MNTSQVDFSNGVEFRDTTGQVAKSCISDVKLPETRMTHVCVSTMTEHMEQQQIYKV